MSFFFFSNAIFFSFPIPRLDTLNFSPIDAQLTRAHKWRLTLQPNLTSIGAQKRGNFYPEISCLPFSQHIFLCPPKPILIDEWPSIFPETFCLSSEEGAKKRELRDNVTIVNQIGKEKNSLRKPLFFPMRNHAWPQLRRRATGHSTFYIRGKRRESDNREIIKLEIYFQGKREGEKGLLPLKSL